MSIKKLIVLKRIAKDHINIFPCFRASVAIFHLRKQILILFLLFSFSAVKSQTPKSYTSSEILLHLKKLNVLGSVLYIAAHPDDENTRLLAYLANEKLYRTGYLSLTRGDGGQNLIGDEQGVDLGLMRTQELLAARRIDGAEQFFSRAFDFGFSKNPEEAMRIWGHDKILSDVVWVIRKFRPDVIITRFPTTGEGGHGHHTASAILAGEAFDAAADPAKFPEQLQNGVTVWQAKRLLWNTFNFGSVNTQSENQFKLDCGEYNALLGKSYGEIAAESRSQHKSQGFGVPAQRGSVTEYFKTIKGEAPEKELVDGATTDWSRAGKKEIAEMVNKIISKYDLFHPENSLAALVKVYKDIDDVKDEYWKKLKKNEVRDIIEQCAGLFIEATSNTQFAVQGDSIKINLVVNNRLGNNILNADAQLNNDFVIFDQLQKNVNAVKTYSLYVGKNTKLTQPYWLENPMDKGSFNITDQQQIGKAQSDLLSIDFSMMIEGVEVTFTKPLLYKYTDPVKGELYQPVNIIPAFSVTSVPKLAINNTNNDWLIKSLKDNNVFRNYGDSGNINETKLDKNQTIKISYPKSTAKTDSAGNASGALMGYHPTSLYNSDGTPYLELHQLNYDHIPSIVYTQPAVFTSKDFDLKTEGNYVGYIPGAGDKIPEALIQMGYKVVTLKESDMTINNLKQFDAIVTGVRAYNINEWVSNSYNVLMDYVKEGGVLLTQYNTNNNIGNAKAKISPYPFTISRNRITDEDAKVNFLLPDSKALNYPNKITAKDFEGWIQERSTYNAENIDPAYQRILSMKDPGEAEQDGALIIANYGKGRFVYSGLVFFRELPAGVPGAYRLFANLIANKRNTYIK